jgi:1,4-dihydroxy-2-naphthoyl-CoA hydrolase
VQLPTDASETPSSGFDAALGIEYVEVSGERCVLRLAIRPDHLQPYGIVHGGVYAALVETAASVGAAVWFGDEGGAVGVTNSTDFLRSVGEGTLTTVATPLQRGRTLQTWQVEVTDDDGRLVAHGKVKLANMRRDR